ncbi:uncharacterized protein LOC123536369 [Mercenaria mercenaria]|uniref:uncharacterized protein LOC123536369 n=1 Tax=Mercenaria mercenaria TaxID=6596 RepID=UPI00234FA9B2|nr:uncharacterized protein LOC123536369 [Mercenaria mercenaria]
MASLFLTLLCVACCTGLVERISGIPFTLTVETAKYTRPNVTCPADKPFIMRNGNYSVCVSSCGPEMVLDGSMCINVTKCTKPVLSDGRCMELCPVGYLYVNFDSNFGDCYGQYDSCSYRINDIRVTSCVKLTYLHALVVCSVFGIILYIAFIWMFFSTRQFPLIKLLTYVKGIGRKKMTSSDGELLINADVEEE